MWLPPDLDGLSSSELRSLVVALITRVTDLERMVVLQRDEIARLKEMPKRPKIKPSGMDNATHSKPSVGQGKTGRRGGQKTVRRTIHEDRMVCVAAPHGSRFKGYEDFVVQDLVFRPHVVRYRRERWLTPDGQTITAPLPASVRGHFGPELQRFVLVQHHQGQVTVRRVAAQLHAIGIDISRRQVMRLLIGGQDGFLDEARDVLRAGLTAGAWISVDDTGARHKAANGVCTQIGNDHFAWFGTTGSKSRLNFLDLLRAGHTDYTINAEALAYMGKRGLAGPVIARLADAPCRHFADQAPWQAHLARLGIVQPVQPGAPVLDPVRLATEGALWGTVKAHGFLPQTVIISDDAGQFDVGRHALCWVHAERLVHKLDAFTALHRTAQAHMRGLIWRFYSDLKAYCFDPRPRRRAALRTRFDRIFRRRTGFVTLDRLLKRLHANKAELLMVLDRPEIPLHTNGSENDIRCQVTKRKVSGGTRSDDGRDCRDAFLGLAKTCAKLGIHFWDYLGSRLAINGCPTIEPLPQIVSMRCRTA
ncbi:MAG: transposase [Pseudomonadota bacterium]|nr:transposase [Pseudomonadota bacterium]